MSLYVLHMFIVIRSRGGVQGNENAVDGLALWLVLLDTWIATVATFLMERETRDAHRQKRFADT